MDDATAEKTAWTLLKLYQCVTESNGKQLENPELIEIASSRLYKEMLEVNTSRLSVKL